MKIGVVLSGCGVYDGTEIHEAVLTLLALDRGGAETACFAPDMEQRRVINDLTGKEVPGEHPNVSIGSARIALGEATDPAKAQVSDPNAIIFQGGFGAANDLCDFALKGAGCAIHPEVARIIRKMYRARKPLGAICIAPAIISKGPGDQGPAVTIGTDKDTAAVLKKLGTKHSACPVRECIVDAQHKIVTTRAYMLANRISETAAGIEELVREGLRLAR